MTYQVTTQVYDRQFTVLYSLDQKKNDEALIRVIDDADRYVYFAIYTFTKDDIADALVRAKQRGLTVWGIVDREQGQTNNRSIVERLTTAGIPLETQKHPNGIMHIKALVTDQAYALGSYNWTEAATSSNDELLEIGTNHSLHDRYLDIIERILVTNQ